MTRIQTLLLGISYILWGVYTPQWIRCIDTSSEAVVRHAGLYVDTESVFEVMEKDDLEKFQFTLLDSNMPGAVIFYSDGCSHCVHYKPRFSHLSNVLMGTFKTAAVNCGNTDLWDLCASFNIRNVPSIRLFTPEGLVLPSEGDNDTTSILVDLDRYTANDENVKLEIKENPTLLVHQLPSDSLAFDILVKYVTSRLNVTFTGEQIMELNKSVSETLVKNRAHHKVCYNEKWHTQEDPFPKRIYDAILGLKYMLSNWIITESDSISVEEVGKIMEFVELNRLYIPVKEMRYSLSHLLIFLMPYAVNATPLPNQEYQSYLKNHIFADFLNTNLDNTVDHLPFLHCKTIPCSIWQLLHILAESMQWHTEYILNDETHCGDHIYIKGGTLSSIVPIHIYNQSMAKTLNQSIDIHAVKYTIPKDSVLFDARHLVHIKRALRIGEMDIKQVLNISSDIGCQVYHPHTALTIIKQFFDRFFQCTECRTHFDQNVKMDVFNLHEINPSDDIVLKLKDNMSNISRVSKAMYKSKEYPKYLTYRLWLWRLHNSVTERVSVFQTVSTLQGFSGYTDYAYCSVYWPRELIQNNIINDEILRDAIMESLSPSDELKNIPERLQGVDLHSVSKLLTRIYWDPQAL